MKNKIEVTYSNFPLHIYNTVDLKMQCNIKDRYTQQMIFAHICHV